MIQTDIKSQLEAKDYVLNKTITRPKTTLWYPVLLFFGSVLIGVVTSIVAIHILNLYFKITALYKVVLVLIFVAMFIWVVSKKVLIMLIECYQHYASDDIRRMCLCKPTCSEYAIMALKKYNLFKALKMIYIRLKKTCTGETYKIDYP